MAKFLFTVLVAEARGKFGNAVFSENRSGAYLRELVRPANPNTTDQQSVRGAFSWISKEWAALTQAQRDGWNTVAADYSSQDVFGRNVRLSGFQVFMKLSANLDNTGQGFYPNASSPVAVPGLIITGGNLSGHNTRGGGTLTIDSDVNAVPADHIIVVSASKPMSAGRTSVAPNEMRQIARELATATPNTSNYWGNYFDKFGAVATGQKVFVSYQYQSNANGQRSNPIFFGLVSS